MEFSSAAFAEPPSRYGLANNEYDHDPLFMADTADIDIGDVHTDPDYDIIAPSPEARSFGFKGFNISVASSLSLIADTIYGATLNEFLLDPRAVIDITSDSTTNPSCASGYDFKHDNVCTRSVFIPGTTALVIDEHYHEADLFVVHNNIGYQLDFNPLKEDFIFDGATHCRIYGTAHAAAQYCFAPATQGGIAASRFFPCESMIT